MIGLTLSGADDRASLPDLIRLADAGAEVAFLYTFDPEGRHRYPPIDSILEAGHALMGRGSLHICGGRARDQLNRCKLSHLVELFQRIQINGPVTEAALAMYGSYFPMKTIITQHNRENAALASLEIGNHAILVDSSGGMGKLPVLWEKPETTKAVGFAGGLGPQNLRDEWPKIAGVAEEGAWIDCESSLRNPDDWFDVEAAMKMVAQWKILQS